MLHTNLGFIEPMLLHLATGDADVVLSRILYIVVGRNSKICVHVVGDNLRFTDLHFQGWFR